MPTSHPVLRLADQHAEARLPCPLCGSEVKGRNVREHLQHKHPGQAPPTSPLRGRGPWGLPRTLHLHDDHLRCGRREAVLPAQLLTGRWERRHSYGNPEGSGTYSTEVVREGAYLQVGELVVLCRKVPGLAKLWTGATPGPRRRRGHVRLAMPEFTALVYHLAGRGDLAPR